MRHKKFSSIGKDLTQEINAGRTYKTKRKINKIAVHCSATKNNKEFNSHDIDKWHQNRWGKNSGCGYHYIILLDGTIEKGRWVDNAGAHVKNYNSKSIGICYIGGLDENGVAVNDQETPEQKASLIKLLKLLTEIYDLDSSDVLGHKEFPQVNKACPCLTMEDIRSTI